MSEKKTTYCQVALTEQANNKLTKFKAKLKDKNLKLSKSEIINVVLEKMSMAEFDKIASSLGATAKASAKARERIMQIYENSNLTKEDLDEILSRLP